MISFPLWWLLRQFIKLLFYLRLDDRWRYCKWVDPYDPLVRQKAAELGTMQAVTDFVASIPWKADTTEDGRPTDVWRTVGEVLTDPTVADDCEGHGCLDTSLRIALGKRGKARCVSGTVFGRCRHMWAEKKGTDEWLAVDTHPIQNPQVFRYENSAMGHKPEFWFDDLRLVTYKKKEVR